MAIFFRCVLCVLLMMCNAAEADDRGMGLALKNLTEKKDQFQIRLYDLTKGEMDCDIYSVSIDRNVGRLYLDFDYRGGTRLKLNSFSDSAMELVGSYPIYIRIIGDSDVKVKLRFNNDGTAEGEWRNYNFSGRFDIVKRFRR